MKVLEFVKGTGTSAAYSVDDGLGSLWDAAERLGRVSIRTETFGPKYKAEITFTRSGGSYIFATGKSDDRDTSLRMAIEEAKALGAA